MAEQKFNGKKLITTQADINYSFILQTGRPMGILVEEGSKRTLYHFDSRRGTPVVTDEIAKKAFTALFKVDINQLELFLVCCDTLESAQHEKYWQMATEIYREHINHLYNSITASKVFHRPVTLKNISKEYDFFADFKIGSDD